MAKSKVKGGKGEVVKSAARALDIIELLVRFPAGLTLTDVGEHLDIPLSSLHNLMNTLLLRGYVTRDQQATGYRLSSKLIQLAAVHHSQHDLISVADPIMEGMSEASAETTSLAILQDDAVVFVHKRAAKNLVQVVNPVGTRVAAHATALGKVMLACLDEGEVDELYRDEDLPTLTSRTVSSKTELKKVLEGVREEGYAVDNAESNEGVWAVAAAIRNRNGAPIAALSIAAPIFRVTAENRTDWRWLVQDGAEQVSQVLGFFE